MSESNQDVVDGNCSGRTCETDDTSEDSSPTDSRYYALMATEKYSKCYKMNHKYRGLAIIFNHSKFEKKEPHIDTTKDCNELEECLKYIGFKVKVYHDSSKHEIERRIKKVSKKDHRDCDCLLIAVLSQGEGGLIQAFDGAYKPEHLWSHFTPDKCPSLAGKPKLFIFEVGRGKNIDSGVLLMRKRRVEYDTSRAPYKIPLQADFLFAYSTPEGYTTWRDANERSWYIQALCSELRERAFTNDLQAILTLVNKRVALNHESVYPSEPYKHRAKQIPCFMTTFTRFLKFSPSTSSSTEVSAINDNNNNI